MYGTPQIYIYIYIKQITQNTPTHTPTHPFHTPTLPHTHESDHSKKVKTAQRREKSERY